MTINDFMTECNYFEYTEEYFDLQKESYQIELMEKYVENKLFAFNNFSESNNSETVKNINEAGVNLYAKARDFIKKAWNIITTKFKNFCAIIKKFFTRDGSKFRKVKAAILDGIKNGSEFSPEDQHDCLFMGTYLKLIAVIKDLDNIAIIKEKPKTIVTGVYDLIKFFDTNFNKLLQNRDKINIPNFTVNEIESLASFYNAKKEVVQNWLCIFFNEDLSRSSTGYSVVATFLRDNPAVIASRNEVTVLNMYTASVLHDGIVNDFVNKDQLFIKFYNDVVSRNVKVDAPGVNVGALFANLAKFVDNLNRILSYTTTNFSTSKRESSLSFKNRSFDKSDPSTFVSQFNTIIDDITSGMEKLNQTFGYLSDENNYNDYQKFATNNQFYAGESKEVKSMLLTINGMIATSLNFFRAYIKAADDLTEYFYKSAEIFKTNTPKTNEKVVGKDYADKINAEEK